MFCFKNISLGCEYDFQIKKKYDIFINNAYFIYSEPYDVTVVTPSVLNVIHGQIVPMDLVKVQTEKECFFSFLSVGWGLMADIDIESERLRAIGEARFAVWGVIRALGKLQLFVLQPNIQKMNSKKPPKRYL